MLKDLFKSKFYIINCRNWFSNAYIAVIIDNTQQIWLELIRNIEIGERNAQYKKWI